MEDKKKSPFVISGEGVLKIDKIWYILKENIDVFDYIKINNFCLSQEIKESKKINQRRREPKGKDSCSPHKQQGVSMVAIERTPIMLPLKDK